MKTLKWLYANKVTLTGFLALLLYVLDEIFNFSGEMNISQEAYYGIATIIFLIVGYAIKSRGIESYEHFKEVVRAHKELKKSKTLEEKVDVLTDILSEENKPENSTE